MQRAGLALALTVASVLSASVALAQSNDEQTDQRGHNLDLFGIESVTEYPAIQYVPMFDGAGCEVDESTIKSLLRLELQKDRGIKLRFVSLREFDERRKELYERPTKILEAAKPFIADFEKRPEGKLWKDALREANHYGSMPVLKFTVRTARIEQTCLAFIEAKLTTFVPLRPGPLSRYVTVELWSEDKSVHVPKANYTVSIAAAAASLWSEFVDEWKRTQAFCAAQATPCSPFIRSMVDE